MTDCNCVTPVPDVTGACCYLDESTLSATCEVLHECDCLQRKNSYFYKDTACGSCNLTCFTGESLVYMSDGTSRPIKHITVGDKVLGLLGEVNTVTHIEKTSTGGRPLVSINGSTPFFTFDHPIITKDGIKSVDSSFSREHYSGIEFVGDLEVGDIIYRHGWECRVDRIDLHDIESDLYDLGLDGSHIYFVNDIAFHNCSYVLFCNDFSGNCIPVPPDTSLYPGYKIVNSCDECGTTPPPDPSGACCYGADQCRSDQYMTKSFCNGLDGVFHENMTCDQVDCETGLTCRTTVAYDTFSYTCYNGDVTDSFDNSIFYPGYSCDETPTNPDCSSMCDCLSRGLDPFLEEQPCNDNRVDYLDGYSVTSSFSDPFSYLSNKYHEGDFNRADKERVHKFDIQFGGFFSSYDNNNVSTADSIRVINTAGSESFNHVMGYLTGSNTLRLWNRISGSWQEKQTITTNVNNPWLWSVSENTNRIAVCDKFGSVAVYQTATLNGPDWSYSLLDLFSTGFSLISDIKIDDLGRVFVTGEKSSSPTLEVFQRVGQNNYQIEFSTSITCDTSRRSFLEISANGDVICVISETGYNVFRMFEVYTSMLSEDTTRPVRIAADRTGDKIYIFDNGSHFVKQFSNNYTYEPYAQNTGSISSGYPDSELQKIYFRPAISLYGTNVNLYQGSLDNDALFRGNTFVVSLCDTEYEQFDPDEVGQCYKCTQPPNLTETYFGGGTEPVNIGTMTRIECYRTFGGYFGDEANTVTCIP